MLQTHFKLYTIGLALILASWGLKHVLISSVIYGGGKGLSRPAVSAEIDALVWEETFDDQLELAELRVELGEDGLGYYDGYDAPKSKSKSKAYDYDDYNDFEEDSSKEDKIREDIAEIQEDIDDARADIEEEYVEAIVESRQDSAEGLDTALSMMRSTLKMKILLDLIKIAGVVLLVVSSIRIVRAVPDPKDGTEGPTRALAITTVALVLLGTFIQGVVSMFS
jgi:hypothetical protein